MVIIYDLETKEIKYTEDNKVAPALPAGTTEEKVASLQKQGLGFISIPYELGSEAKKYKVNTNEAGDFIGLQPNVANNALK